MLSLLLGKKPLQNYVISSPIEGVLMKDGKPMANTKIIRELIWFGGEETRTHEFTTNDKGEFSLPVYEKELKLGKLTEFSATTSLYVNTTNEDDFFYHTSNRSGNIYSETKEPLQNLVCDMNQKEDSVTITRESIYSRCVWSGKENVKDIFSEDA